MTVPTPVERAHGLSFAEFWQQFVRIPDRTGALVAPVPHREQLKFIDAIDRRVETGQTEFLLHWAKKSAKSFTAAAALVFLLVCDEHNVERLIAVLANDLDQSGVVGRMAKQIVQRHPWLAQRVRPLRNELV